MRYQRHQKIAPQLQRSFRPSETVALETTDSSRACVTCANTVPSKEYALRLVSSPYKILRDGGSFMDLVWTSMTVLCHELNFGLSC